MRKMRHQMALSNKVNNASRCGGISLRSLSHCPCLTVPDIACVPSSCVICDLLADDVLGSELLATLHTHPVTHNKSMSARHIYNVVAFPLAYIAAENVLTTYTTLATLNIATSNLC